MKNENTRYRLVCGMEVHAELKTASKMFCGCKNDPFHAAEPNIYTCPVCLGMPGALPVANKKAVEWTVKLGLALNCKINLYSKFDRKHYFYPDLPKGYQISQYDEPFCVDGVLDTEFGSVRIRRIHLEEDTAKLVHKNVDGKKVSLVDFNRSSVPLIEIVTEPDIHTPEHAKAYGKALRQIIRFLDISDCDMEQGSMRLEANVSVRKPEETELPNYKVELKNINSFRFVEKAIEYEIGRQSEILDVGEIPIQETRGWRDDEGVTFSQRTKEDAEDYRYFPDPDLPPVRFTEAQIEEWRIALPELPKQKQARWLQNYDVEEKYSDVLLDEKETADWAEHLFIEAKKQSVDVNKLANAVVNRKVAGTVGDEPSKVIGAFKQTQQTDQVDPELITAAIKQVIAESPDAVAQYKAGKTQVIGFFIGQVIRKLGKKLDAKEIQPKIVELLK
jgi:aspartyl-tRNA(Asn)/glutamyl-tRNA(Gln) amidotransferase subunit B